MVAVRDREAPAQTSPDEGPATAYLTLYPIQCIVTSLRDII
jgi:hypothetical protein